MKVIVSKILRAAALFVAVFLPLWLSHQSANAGIAEILSGDGCGQIIDVQTFQFVDTALSLAAVLIALYAASFAVAIVYKSGVKLLKLTAILVTASFIAAGLIHWHFRQELVACDIFGIAPSTAIWMNIGVAMIVLIAALLASKQRV